MSSRIEGEELIKNVNSEIAAENLFFADKCENAGGKSENSRLSAPDVVPSTRNNHRMHE
jgi:hypothetical protein